MTTIDALMAEGHNRLLRRHGGLKQIFYLAPASTEVPESLFESGNELINPTGMGFFSVGLVNDDGINFEETFETEGSSSAGYLQETREDLSSSENTLGVTLQESYNRYVEEVVRGADYSNVDMSAQGEIIYDNPGFPIFKEYRGLALAVDGPPDDQWIMGELFFALKLSSRDARAWAKGSTVDRPVTFKQFPDAELGLPSRSFVAGTGPIRHAKALGFSAPSGGGGGD